MRERKGEGEGWGEREKNRRIEECCTFCPTLRCCSKYDIGGDSGFIGALMHMVQMRITHAPDVEDERNHCDDGRVHEEVIHERICCLVS